MSDQDRQSLAEFLAENLDRVKEAPPCTSIWICDDGKAIQIHLDTKADEIAEHIPGEGGDICLFRNRKTGKVTGCRLPLYQDRVTIGRAGHDHITWLPAK